MKRKRDKVDMNNRKRIPKRNITLFILIITLVILIFIIYTIINYGSKGDLISPEIDQNNKDARNGKGFVYLMTNDIDKSEQEFLNVLEIDNNNFEALKSLGIINYLKGNYDVAIAYYQKALDNSKGNQDQIFWRIGNTYAKKKDFENSFLYISKAVKINNNNPYAYYAWARYYYEKEEYAKAKSNIDKFYSYGDEVDKIEQMDDFKTAIYEKNS